MIYIYPSLWEFFLSYFLATRGSRLIVCIFCISSRCNHFYKDSLFLFLVSAIKIKIWALGEVHYYWDVIANSLT